MTGSKTMLDIKLQKNKNKERGIAIYIAVTITAVLVLVSFAIVNLAIKQINISAISRDSQSAFYVADSGIECALYWDLKNPSNPGQSAFATTTTQSINCDNAAIGVTHTVDANGFGTTTFQVLFPPNPYCTNVDVAKYYIGSVRATKIESRGYNSCSTTNSRRVERAIVVNY